MAASEAQIAANRRNSTHSTGPKTESGKSRSRTNATTHGLASELLDAEMKQSPEFLDRRAKWGAEQKPVGESAEWALDRVVAASLRIERCEHAIDGLCSATAQRARLSWDEDRAVEAATVFGRLGRDPVLASRQLQTTLAGVNLLIEAWLALATALQSEGHWTEAEASRALDLFGVATDLRSGQTLIDSIEGTDLFAYRCELVSEEIERLEALRDEAMTPLEESERRRAMTGGGAMHSKLGQLLFRYERDAWTRYNKSMKEVKAPPPPPTPPAATPPRRSAILESQIAEVPVPKSEAVLEIEREIEARGGFQKVAAEARAASQMAQIAARAALTERTQFAEVSVGLARR